MSEIVPVAEFSPRILANPEEAVEAARDENNNFKVLVVGAPIFDEDKLSRRLKTYNFVVNNNSRIAAGLTQNHIIEGFDKLYADVLPTNDREEIRHSTERMFWSHKTRDVAYYNSLYARLNAKYLARAIGSTAVDVEPAMAFSQAGALNTGVSWKQVQAQFRKTSLQLVVPDGFGTDVYGYTYPTDTEGDHRTAAVYDFGLNAYPRRFDIKASSGLVVVD